jgi:hypothetical protein
MRDDLFGTLTRRDGGWEGQAAFGYLATFGQALDEDDADDPRPPLPPETGPTRGMIEARGQLEAILAQSTGDVAAVLAAALGSAQRAHQAPGPSLAKEKSEPTAEELALRRGVCDLAVDTGARHGKPSRAQRAAWRALLDRGDALWDEIAAHALAAYLRQRPMRVRMWRRVYGDHLLDRRLPEAGTVAAMKPPTSQSTASVRGTPRASGRSSATAAWPRSGPCSTWCTRRPGRGGRSSTPFSAR